MGKGIKLHYLIANEILNQYLENICQPLQYRNTLKVFNRMGNEWLDQKWVGELETIELSPY